jgi:TolA-binding protein
MILPPTALNRLRLATLVLLALPVAGIVLRAQASPAAGSSLAAPAPAAASPASVRSPDAPATSPAAAGHPMPTPVAPAGRDQASVTAPAESPRPPRHSGAADGGSGHPLSALDHPLSDAEAQGLLAIGASLTGRGDYAGATIAYRQILDGKAGVAPTKSALLGLAHMHRKQGSLTKAAAIYEKFLQLYPDDDHVPDALLDLGRTLRSIGAPGLAIARFYNVINSTLKLPTQAGFEHYQLLAKTAQFEIAETHFENGEYAEATKFFSRLRMLDLAPADRARAHFMSAFSLYRDNNFTDAIATLRAFLDQSPDDKNAPEAWYLLSMSLRSLKRPQEALTATLQLLRTEKARTATDPQAWIYWQRRTGNQLANDFFQSGDILNALAIYQSLATLSVDPNWSIPVTYQVGLCYERLGDIARACRTYRDILDRLGSTPPAALGDIARMAATRLAQAAWRDTFTHQVTALFTTTTGQVRPPSPPAHDVNGSPATAPAAL